MKTSKTSTYSNVLDSRRFAVITSEDTIFLDSNDVLECYHIFKMFEAGMKGIFDFAKSVYLDEVDIIDLVGVSLHSGE